MKYFETKHEKDSARITTLIIVILVLLVFIVGPKYMDPPEEYGIAVNFGTTDFGSGNVQPKEPIKSQPKEVIEEPKVQEEVTKPDTSTPQETTKEEVLTADNAESIAMKKQKEAERKKAVEEAKAKAEAERVENERREKEEKKKKLDDLIGGIGKTDGKETGGEGDDNKAGDKGQLNGGPYAPYKGIPGAGSGGVGYGLNGRGAPDFKMYEGCENEYGLIVVDIVVDRNGKVIDATPGVKGSNNITSCLKAQAKKIAMSYVWPKKPDAPSRQYGKVSVNFTPTN